MKTKYVKFRVSNLEKKVIERRAKIAGMTTSEFLRNLAFEKNIKARLSQDEIECYKTLTKFRNNFKNISNLFKLGDITQVKEESAKTAKEIKAHLNNFK